MPNARLIGCAIRGQPKVGFPSFHVENGSYERLGGALWTRFAIATGGKK